LASAGATRLGRIAQLLYSFQLGGSTTRLSRAVPLDPLDTRSQLIGTLEVVAWRPPHGSAAPCALTRCLARVAFAAARVPFTVIPATRRPSQARRRLSAAGHVAARDYLSHLAHSGRKSSTIGQRAALIAWTVRAGKGPATEDVLMQMVALCPDNMIGRRDRGAAGLGLCRRIPAE